MILYKAETTDRQRYIWNMMGGLFNAVSSVLLLSITTRVSGAAAGGIFSLAYSTAQLLESIGLTNVREIQSTDVKHEYSFSSYLGMRVLTCIVMIAAGIIYAFAAQRDPVKRWAVILLTGYKSIDALADVFQGLFQLNNRIDLAGKELALRPFLSTAAFFLILVLTHQLILACAAMIVVSVLWLLIFDIPVGKVYEKLQCSFNLKVIGRILMTCLPLFIGNFMMNYTGNAPKYAIDAHMDDIAQNTYGFLAMPAFVINLFSLFYFRPILTSLAGLWAEEKYTDFKKNCTRCMVVIVVLTGLAEAGTYFLGIPVLNLFSGRELGAYRSDLMVIMLGGSMTAFITLFHNVFACMRKQKFVLVPYGIGFACAFSLSPLLVETWGIFGACLSYTIANAVIALAMAAGYALMLKKVTK